MVKQNSKKIPTGVKVISVLYYIGAVVAVIAGIALLIGAGALATLVSSVPGLALIAGVGAVAFGILAIILGVIDFFLGRGLWKLQNWARIVTIIFAVLGLLGGISSLFSGEAGSGIVNIIISGVIGWYLWFNKN